MKAANGGGGMKGGDVESGGGGKAAAAKQVALVTFAIAFYASCSSLMLIVNKVTVHHVPAPGFVLFCQLAVSAFVMFSVGQLGIAKVDALEWPKVRAFIPVACAFLGAIFTNMKTLQYANVETFIVFRSSTPLIISVLDYMYLGRELPTLRSWASLVAILCGAVGYMATDSGFEVRSYSWALAWFAVFSFDQVYIKHVCDTVEMTSWGRSYYTNLLGLPPVMFLMVVFQEWTVLEDQVWSAAAMGVLGLSCAIGVCMSYSAFLLRANVSATMFTVVGIMCKIGTVVINQVIWDKHASANGLAALLVCLLAGTFYKQAPRRGERAGGK